MRIRPEFCAHAWVPYGFQWRRNSYESRCQFCGASRLQKYPASNNVTLKRRGVGA